MRRFKKNTNQLRFIEHFLWPEAILGAKDTSGVKEAKRLPSWRHNLVWERELTKK